MKRGTIDIINPVRGTTDIQKIYRGTSLIWERTSPLTITSESVNSLTGLGGNTITIPTGATFGDIVILLQHSRNNSSTLPTAVNPTGFTQLYNDTQSNFSTRAMRQMISWAPIGLTGSIIAGGTISGMTTGTIKLKWAIVLKANKNISALTFTASTAKGDASSISTSVSYTGLSGDATYALALYGNTDGTVWAGITFSLTPNTWYSSGDVSSVFTSIQNSNPSGLTASLGSNGLTMISAAGFKLS